MNLLELLPSGPTEHTHDYVGFYEREFYPFSNFSSFRLMWKGIDFDTSEHAYHCEKFGDNSDQHQEIRFDIMRARSAHDCYKIAERHKHDRLENWDDIKVSIMYDIIKEKTDQHEYVKRKLIQTGNRNLIEDSWRDNYWGWGPNKDGENILGKLWMRLRTKLQRDS